MICQECKADLTEQSSRHDSACSQFQDHLATMRYGSHGPLLTFDALLVEHGSRRRLFEAYWTGTLSSEQECFIEENTTPEVRFGYKPMVVSLPRFPEQRPATWAERAALWPGR